MSCDVTRSLIDNALLLTERQFSEQKEKSGIEGESSVSDVIRDTLIMLF